jgi:hypothetical protein
MKAKRGIFTFERKFAYSRRSPKETFGFHSAENTTQSLIKNDLFG